MAPDLGLHRVALIGLWVTALGAACRSSTEEDCLSTTDEVQARLLKPSCGISGCHGSLKPALGLDLVSPGLEARLVDVPSNGCLAAVLVTPGDPEGSHLVRKLADPLPTCGDRMPLDTEPMAADRLACLRRWITRLSPGSPDGGGGPDAPGPDAPNCPDGQTACAGTCVDTRSDATNCGSCGTTCPAASTCVSGKCICSSGLTLCGSSCVDITSSVMNCGGCGKSCPGRMVCAGGACAASCPAGTASCGGSCVDTSTSALDCGGCGKVCTVGQTCVGGVCACPSSSTTCGAGCVDLATDAANCGACGKACPAGQVCSSGVCGCGPTVSFAGAVQPIFSASCVDAGCHTGIRPAGGLGLQPGSAFANLVGKPSDCPDRRPLVTAGSVSQSYLVNKLTGIGICLGTQMPKAGSALPTSEIDSIRRWICQGAPND